MSWAGNVAGNTAGALGNGSSFSDIASAMKKDVDSHPIPGLPPPTPGVQVQPAQQTSQQARPSQYGQPQAATPVINGFNL